MLNLASKAACYLRLVDSVAFVDRRNPDPVIYAAFWLSAAEVDVVVGCTIWRTNPCIDGTSLVVTLGGRVRCRVLSEAG